MMNHQDKDKEGNRGSASSSSSEAQNKPLWWIGGDAAWEGTRQWIGGPNQFPHIFGAVEAGSFFTSLASFQGAVTAIGEAAPPVVENDVVRLDAANGDGIDELLKDNRAFDPYEDAEDAKVSRPAPVQNHGGGVVGIEGAAALISAAPASPHVAGNDGGFGVGGVEAAPVAVAPSEPAITKVEQLRPQMTGVTLTLKVVSKKIVGRKGCKHGPRSGMQVAECLVGDETAIVVFRAKNEQVDMMNEGATVTLRNAQIEMYKGSMRLVVNKSGRIEVADPAGFTVNENNNISLVEFECITVVA